MTTEEHDKVAAGQLVLMTKGAYSDFTVVGLFRAQRDFNMVKLMIAHRTTVNPNNDRYGDKLDEFAASLTRDGYLVDEPFSEQDLGAYDTFDRAGLNLAQATS